MIHAGREAAFERMRAEAKREGVHGVVGVTSELRSLGGNSEFLFVGSGVSGQPGAAAFTSAGDAQELYCHMDAGYEPARVRVRQHRLFGGTAVRQASPEL